MVADAVLYHPSVAHYLKFVSTTVGRDKLLRTLQYFSRFYAWYLYRTNHPQSEITPYQAVKKQFGLARKILRIGKVVEHLKSAAIAADAKGGDVVLKYLAIGRQLGYATYMLLDHITVLNAAGIKPLKNGKKLGEDAYRAWAVGLTFSLVADIYKLYGQQQRAQYVNAKDGEGAVEVKKLAKERRDTLKQLVTDVCDICAPIYALGWSTSLDEGLVGLLGTLSSVMGVMSQWQKTA